MYIIIVGAGEVGGYLARILADEKHDVAIIETNGALCRSLESSLDALVVHGTGASHGALTSAGIRRADLVIAVTEVDEVNMVACMTASKLGPKARTVARVRESAHLSGESLLAPEELGIDLVVGPEQVVATKVGELLSYEGSGEIRYLPHGVVLLDLPLSSDSPLVHDKLVDLAPELPAPSLVIGAHGPRGMRIPRGNDILAVHERAYVMTMPENIDQFVILSGKPWHHVRHVLIIGCGNIGFHLAKQLEAQRLFPTIIEADRARAAWVAENLTKSLVLHGDGTDPDLLREQLEEAADAVVVLLEDDEKAVLIGLLSKHLGAKKVIVRSDNLAYAPIAHSMGIDALISPRRALANAILRFVRRGRVESTHMLGDHEAEILELIVPDQPRNPEIVEKPLKELEFPEGALLGAIIRDGKPTIADGSSRLRPGDDLLVVTTPASVAKVERMFS